MIDRTAALLAVVALGACATNALPGPPMPTGLAPVSAAEVGEWASTAAPTSGRTLRFRAAVMRRGESGRLRGTAWILPPDSLRFDFRGPLGSGNGAAVVIGDSAVWAEPAETVHEIVPSFPLLWAMLGHTRPPAAGAALRGFRDERITAWQAVVGADTVDYVLVHAPRRELVADVRGAQGRTGRVHTTFDGEGLPTTSRLDIPAGSIRLTLDYYDHRPITRIADSLWRRPSDAP